MAGAYVIIPIGKMATSQVSDRGPLWSFCFQSIYDYEVV